MKKSKPLFFALALLLAFLPAAALAFTPALITSGDFAYIAPSPYNQASLYEWRADEAELVIPGELDGVPLLVLRSGAVKGKRALTQVIFPCTQMAVAAGAFADCPHLQSVCLPDTVQITGNAFQGCPELKEFVLDENAQRYGVLDGALMDMQQMILLTPARGSDGGAAVPAGTRQLGAEAFLRREDLTAIHLPQGLTRIGYSAFERCTSLREITLPDSLEAIGPLAFFHCESLVSVVLPASVTTLQNGAFGACTQLEEVVVPPSVTEIGQTAFLECPRLTLIVTPGSYAEGWAEKWKIPYTYAE